MKRLSLVFIYCLLHTGINAQSSQLTSPDGKLQFTFDLLGDGLTYKIECQQIPVILSSVLGLTGVEKGFSILDISKSKKDTVWKPVYGERSEVRDIYEKRRFVRRASGSL